MLIKGHKHAPCNLKLQNIITVNLYIPELIMKLWTQLNFNLLLMSKDVEYIWDLLKSGITSAFSLFTPVYTQRHPHFPKWFTGDIRHQINCLHTLRRKKATASHCIKPEVWTLSCKRTLLLLRLALTQIWFLNVLAPTPQWSFNTWSLCLCSNMWQL